MKVIHDNTGSARSAINDFFAEVEGAAKRYGITGWVFACSAAVKDGPHETEVVGGFMDGAPMQLAYLAGHCKGAAQERVMTSMQRTVQNGERRGSGETRAMYVTAGEDPA
jgi:hypothetical protein